MHPDGHKKIFEKSKRVFEETPNYEICHAIVAIHFAHLLALPPRTRERGAGTPAIRRRPPRPPPEARSGTASLRSRPPPGPPPRSAVAVVDRLLRLRPLPLPSGAAVGLQEAAEWILVVAAAARMAETKRKRTETAFARGP